jgi:hypothetical protein
MVFDQLLNDAGDAFAVLLFTKCVGLVERGFLNAVCPHYLNLGGGCYCYFLAVCHSSTNVIHGVIRAK